MVMKTMGSRGALAALWQAALLNILLLQVAEAVIPRHYRLKQDAQRQDMMERAKLLNAGIVPGMQPLLPRTATRPDMQDTHQGTANNFRPTVARCCKIGQKTARKGKVCDLDLLGIKMAATATQEVAGGRKSGQLHRKWSQMGEEHWSKVESCSESSYLSNFTKCCQYRLQFVREMDLCKKHARGKGRRQCRQEVRQKYA